MTQLEEEYDTSKELCEQTGSVLEAKEDVINDLEQKYKDLAAEYAQAEIMQKQEDMVGELKRELAWAHVEAKGKEFGDASQKTARQEVILERLDDRLKRAVDAVSSGEEKITKLQLRLEEAATPAELERQNDQVQEALRAGRTELKQAFVRSMILTRVFMSSLTFIER